MIDNVKKNELVKIVVIIRHWQKKRSLVMIEILTKKRSYHEILKDTIMHIHNSHSIVPKNKQLSIEFSSNQAT
jgi:hypothetical protein